jgi:FHA domain
MLLVFTSEDRERRAVEINRARITIGRIAENDVQLVDDKVSRHHAVIEMHDGGRVVLRDLDSRNGTIVDGVRLSGSRVLTGGEHLQFGDEQLRVEAHPGPLPRAPGEGEANAGEATAGAAPPARGAVGSRSVFARFRVGGAVMIVVVLAAVAVGVAQLLLPGVAERKLRSDLARYGVVRRVHIESSPAIQLLWHRADLVDVAMDSYRSKPSGQHGSLADFLSKTRDTAKLDVSVGILRSHLVTLHEVRLHKEGDVLVAQARLTQQDLSAALPSFLNLRPVSATENGIVARVSASVLGHRVTERIAVLADSGRVVVRPEGIPFASLARITVFGDPRIYVQSLGAELRGQNYMLTVRALLK